MDEKQQPAPVITDPQKQSPPPLPTEPPGALGQPLPRNRLVTLLVLSVILLLIALACAFMLWSDARHDTLPTPPVTQTATT